MPKINNSKNVPVALCDVSFIPSLVYMRVEVDPYKSPEGVPVGRQYIRVCDRAIAKAVARDPQAVDAEAGIDVPVAPPVGDLEYFGRRRVGAVSLKKYLQRLDEVWQEAIQNNYRYTVFLCDPSGSAAQKVETARDNNFTMYARVRTIFSSAVKDDAVRVYYNTPAEKTTVGSSTRNECVTKLLSKVGCSDTVIGDAIMQRYSIQRNAPLGLTKELLKGYFGTDAPATSLTGRRVRVKNAETAAKRRKTLKKGLLANGVTPKKGEIVMVRISADPVNAFSEVIVAEKSMKHHLAVLLGFKGELQENAVKSCGDEREICVITYAKDGDVEVRAGRTNDAEAYGFNETAARFFPSIDMTLLEGPVIVCMRKGEEYVHFDLQAFRKYLMGK